MSKVELDDVVSGYRLSKINENFQKIETELNERVLYRDVPDGEPNTMQNPLDMNGQAVLNLPAPATPNSPVRLQDMQTAVVGLSPASLIPFTPSVGISSTTVQTAIEEVFNELTSFSQAGTDAVARSVQDKLREFEITPEDFDNGSRSDQLIVNMALSAIAAVGFGRLRLLRMYTLTSTVTVPNYTTIIGTRQTGFKADTLTFTNTSLSNKYGSNSLMLNCSGLTVSPFTPSQGIRLEGFTIEGNQVDGRQVSAVAARNAKDFVATKLNIHSFSLGYGIIGASLVGNWSIDNCWIHDFTENSTWLPSQNPQMTGIEIDNDIINSIGSSYGRIVENTIRDLIPGANFISSRGYESDGINIHRPASHILVSLNTITGVGEGVDNFGDNIQISDNSIDKCALFSVKMIHGASSCQIKDNTLTNWGLSAITLSGTLDAVDDIKDNVVSGNLIRLGGYGPVAASGTIAAIRIQEPGGATGKVRNSLITDNRIAIGSTEEYGFVDDSTGSGNLAYDNYLTVETGTSLIKRVHITAGSTVWTPLIPSRTRSTLSSDLVVPTVTFTKVPMDSVGLDINGEIDTVNDRWVAKEPNPGVQVAVKLRVGSAGAVGTRYQINIRKGGSDFSVNQFIVSTNLEQTFSALSPPLSIFEGEYIEVFVWQNSGSSQSITANADYTTVSIIPC